MLSIRETSDRAESVVRFNVLVVGLVVTAVSVLVRAQGEVGDVPAASTAAVALAMGLLLASTAFAVLSYLKRGIAVGLDADDLLAASESEMDHHDLLEEAIRSYREALIRNEEVMSVAARRFRRSLQLLLAGIGLLAGASVLLLLGGGI